MNSNENAETISLKRFHERIGKHTSAREITTGRQFTLGDSIEVEPKYVMVLELK